MRSATPSPSDPVAAAAASRPTGLGADAAAELLAWFDGHARDLPWRRDRSPYRVWISEVMLQQTRVATVAPRFERWFARFPDVHALADADLDDVLHEWEGMGYYHRARSLHRTARIVAFERDGRFPDDEEGLRALPGIGAYSAAAIAALAFGRRTVALDAGVRRLAARLTADRRPKDRDLRGALLGMVPGEDAARAAEALIELAATVCTPRAPGCTGCPLAFACLGLVAGPERFPERRRRRPTPTHVRYALVHTRPGAIWLRRRPESGLLGGTWGPPQRDAAPAGRRLDPVRQVYSHFRLELIPVLVGDRPGPAPAGSAARWVGAAELDALPLSAVDRQLIRLLQRDCLLETPA